MAGVIDKVALIRSIVGMIDEHSSFQNVTGFPMGQSQREGKPSFGSVITRMQGPVNPLVPPFVDLFPVMQHRPYNSPGPGFLGHAYKASRMDGDDLALLKPPANVSPERFDRRRGLLDQFDQLRRQVDNAEIGGMDDVYRRAFDVLTSDKVAKALDVSREDPEVARPLRHRLVATPGRRRADVERPAPDRPPAGRSRGALCHSRLWILGHSRRRISVGSASTCRCSIRGSPPWSRIFTPAGWTATSRSSSGASSAALPRSTRTPGAITGHASTRLSCAAAA